MYFGVLFYWTFLPSDWVLVGMQFYGPRSALLALESFCPCVPHSNSVDSWVVLFLYVLHWEFLLLLLVVVVEVVCITSQGTGPSSNNHIVFFRQKLNSEFLEGCSSWKLSQKNNFSFWTPALRRCCLFCVVVFVMTEALSIYRSRFSKWQKVWSKSLTQFPNPI